MQNERRRRLRERIARSPRSVRFEELCRLLEAYGWVLDRTRGSHHVYRLGGASITVPGSGGDAPNAGFGGTTTFTEANVFAVPEPSSAMLLGLGSLVLSYRRRK